MVVELNDTSKMKDLIIVKQPLQSHSIGITEMMLGGKFYIILKTCPLNMTFTP